MLPLKQLKYYFKKPILSLINWQKYKLFQLISDTKMYCQVFFCYNAWVTTTPTRGDRLYNKWVYLFFLIQQDLVLHHIQMSPCIQHWNIIFLSTCATIMVKNEWRKIFFSTLITIVLQTPSTWKFIQTPKKTKEVQPPNMNPVKQQNKENALWGNVCLVNVKCSAKSGFWGHWLINSRLFFFK